jgi:hypothetical protein
MNAYTEPLRYGPHDRGLILKIYFISGLTLIFELSCTVSKKKVQWLKSCNFLKKRQNFTEFQIKKIRQKDR